MDGPVVWKVTRELAHTFDCTVSFITSSRGCGGGCCRGRAFWPPTTGDGACARLTPTGCDLTPLDRPVTCLIYPLRLVKGTLVLFHRARFKANICRGAYNQGPPMVDALREQLLALFGQEQYDRVRVDVLAGRMSWVQPSPEVLAAYEREAAWEEANQVPEPRTLFTVTPL